MEEGAVSPSGRRQQLLAAYRESLFPFLKSPAAWLFSTAWLISVAYLITTGRMLVFIDSLRYPLIALVFGLLTIALTSQAKSLPPLETHCSRPQLWLQVSILALVILFTAYIGIMLHQHIPQAIRQLPVLYPMAIGLYRLFTLPPLLSDSSVVVIPLLYFVIPFPLLLLLGARPRELGFARGYRSWIVALLWSILPLILIALNLIGGQASFGQTLLLLYKNIFRNGFFEEFLFRGALMSRLTYLLDANWGLALSSLLFGLWHIGLQTSNMNGDWLAGLANCVLMQAVFGLGMALVLRRTCNLLAPSIYHVLINTAG